MLTTTWYIDFEGYQYNNRYIVKEIAILNKNNKTECYYYFTQNPSDVPLIRPINKTLDYQHKRHRLDWEFGNTKFLDAIADIKDLIGRHDTVLAKGPEKTRFLKKWLPQITEMCWLTTPFKELRRCCGEICHFRHGLNCARRKVFELYAADCLY